MIELRANSNERHGQLLECLAPIGAQGFLQLALAQNFSELGWHYSASVVAAIDVKEITDLTGQLRGRFVGAM